jgi:hypothetical protein
MTMTFPVRFDRRLQFWRYGPPTGELHIRGNKSTYPMMGPITGTRIDIRFKGVTEIRLARLMHYVSIDLLDRDDPRLPGLGIHTALDRCVFSVEADDYSHGYVLATGISVTEDYGEFDEPPPPVDSEYTIRSERYP